MIGLLSEVGVSAPSPLLTSSAPVPSLATVVATAVPLADLPAVAVVEPQIKSVGQGLGLVRGRLNQILKPLNVEIVKFGKPRADMVPLLQSLTTDQDFASLVQSGHSDEDMVRVYDAFLNFASQGQLKSAAEIQRILQSSGVTPPLTSV